MIRRTADAVVPGRRPLRVGLAYVGQPESDRAPVMTPPLGVQLLATVLVEAGHDVVLTDSRLEPSAPRLLDAHAERRLDLVGVSFLSSAAEHAFGVAAAVRAAGVPTVAGGVHTTVSPQAVLDTGAFDTVVVGEGERAILELCATVVAGAPLPDRIDGAVAQPYEPPPLVVLDPYRARYVAQRGADDRFVSYPVQLGRGCPMRCTFCEMGREGSLAMDAVAGYRVRDPDGAVAEVAGVAAELGVNYVVVVDSIATLHEPTIVRFLDGLLPIGLAGVQCNAHVNKFGPRVAAALARHGDRASVWFGFETGSDTLTARLRKGHDVRRALKVARLALSTRARVGVNLMVGVPWETESDRRDTDEFVRAVLAAQEWPGQAVLNPNICNPLPGTVLYREVCREGLLVDPTDSSVWSADRIRAEGRGPVVGVDYAAVLRDYDRYLAMNPVDDADDDDDDDVAAVPVSPLDHRPWAASGD